MNNEFMKGVFAILALVAIIVVISLLFLKTVRMILQHRTDRNTRQLEAMLKLVEQGAPVPEGLLDTSQSERTKGDLRRGLVLVCSGIGLSLFLFTLSDHSAWGLGLIPIFSGVGYLLSAKLAQRE